MSSPADVRPSAEQSVADRSLGDLISEVTQDLSTLMRQELDLAKAAIAGYFVLLFVSIALWWAIGSATGLGWSAVIVAAIWGVVGAILAVAGRKSLRSVRGLPKTANTVKKIPDALKGNE